jgi:hypothetical protein
MSYDEVAGSPKESLSESSGSSAERYFLVPWNTRLTFAQLLVSTAAAYPHFPQSRVVSVDLKPWMDADTLPSGTVIDPSVQSNGYGTQPCLITIKYGPDYTKKVWPSGFTKPAIRYGTELRFQIQSTASFFLVPAASCKWEDDDQIPVPENVNSIMLIPKKGLQFQWDFVDDPPITRLDSMLGRVNSDTFLGSPAETLLFESYDVAESFRAAPFNPHTNRVTVQLTQQKIWTGTEFVGWNHDYREEPAGWEKLLLSDDEPRYKLTAFASMFT